MSDCAYSSGGRRAAHMVIIAPMSASVRELSRGADGG
jgi:hypothetical protein